MVSSKITVVYFLLFGMVEFKIDRDWRTIKALADRTQNYRNGAVSQFVR